MAGELQRPKGIRRNWNNPSAVANAVFSRSPFYPEDEKEEMIFLGREISEQRNYSEKIAERIDEEVDIIIKGAQKQAEAVLIKHKALLEKVAQDLFEKEIIEREEFEKLIKSK